MCHMYLLDMSDDHFNCWMQKGGKKKKKSNLGLEVKSIKTNNIIMVKNLELVPMGPM